MIIYQVILQKKSSAIYPEINFFQYPGTNSKKYSNESLEESPIDKNHLVVFLKAETLLGSKLRKLDDVIQSVIKTRFECINRAQLGLSYYHDTKVLRAFAAVEALETNDYSNLGQWFNYTDSSSVFDKELVPACYGSLFIIHEHSFAFHLQHWFPIIKAMGTGFGHGKRVDRPILIQYIERSFAAIFSDGLPEEKILSIRGTTPDVITKFPCIGALTPSEASMDFFTGGILKRQDRVDISKIRLSLVISHCNEDMS